MQPGDKLLVVVRGKTVIILPRPRSWAKTLRGLATETYPEGYVNKERDSWG